MRVRGFEVVKGVDENEVKLPERGSKGSAGYDFFATEDVTIPSMLKEWILSIVDSKEHKIKPFIVWTDVKSYMQDDEVLKLYNRSSNPKKLGLILANSVGIIDKDYYENMDNDGNIGFAFYNIFPFSVTIKKGDKIGQGLFSKFLYADNDNVDSIRTGGFGSTGK